MKNTHGKDAFLDYYAHVLGESGDVLDALERDTVPIIRVHAKQHMHLQEAWLAAGLSWKPILWHPSALQWPPESPFGQELPGYNDHWFYPMNASSLLPVIALDAKPGERILDACAAPGGKAIMIADAMQGTGEFLCNDTSADRRRRLADLLQNWGHEWVRITSMKAEILFKRDKEGFDRILADVPCSSEKHVWNSPRHLEQWSENRIKQLKQRQIAIASGLFEALRPGGRMVYSTCALTPEENEYVIDRLLKKKKDRARLVPWNEAVKNEAPQHSGIAPLGEVHFDLSAVNRIWPGKDPISGIDLDPMFVAIIERVVE